MILLEIAVFNIHAATAAAAAGADRLELCENPSDGGTTPSYGTLKVARENISIPIFPIIRPRGGDFVYTESEFSVMEKDIALCKELHFEGVVFGALQADGSIDAKRISKLVSLAYPMEVTFHRAFDRAADPLQALETLISSGCSRILTSGQVPNAMDGKELIRTLIIQAEDRITILPGSGVRSNNIAELVTYTGAVEMHSSARMMKATSMQYASAKMQETLSSVHVDEGEIRLMREALINAKVKMQNAKNKEEV